MDSALLLNQNGPRCTAYGIAMVFVLLLNRHGPRVTIEANGVRGTLFGIAIASVLPLSRYGVPAWLLNRRWPRGTLYGLATAPALLLNRSRTRGTFHEVALVSVFRLDGHRVRFTIGSTGSSRNYLWRRLRICVTFESIWFSLRH